MSIDACIAHAIHSDLDILEVLPEVHDLPMEDLESYIERFVVDIQSTLRQAIIERGEPFIRSKDAAGLCATCLESGVSLPASTLLKICQTIMQLIAVDARFVLDTDEGASLYYVKMEVSVN